MKQLENEVLSLPSFSEENNILPRTKLLSYDLFYLKIKSCKCTNNNDNNNNTTLTFWKIPLLKKHKIY